MLETLVSKVVRLSKVISLTPTFVRRCVPARVQTCGAPAVVDAQTAAPKGGVTRERELPERLGLRSAAVVDCSRSR